MSRHSIGRTSLTALHTVFVYTVLSLPLAGLGGAASVEPCTEIAASSGWRAPEVIAGDVRFDFDTLIGILSEGYVVLVGESHDRYEHHLNQLEIICRLHRRNPDLVVALELFQQPFQAHLDDFVAGRIDTEGMLRATEYYNRWRFDYRLYEPIMTFTRAQGIPLVALNLPGEITAKVGLDGIAGLSEQERAELPDDIDRTDRQYRERIKYAFEQHPEETRGDFERFFEVQLLWDEGMADRAARIRDEHPDSRLVVLAGTGHVIRTGIPARFTRRKPADAISVVLQIGDHDPPSFREEDGDFLIVSKKLELPPAGMLGVMLDTEAGNVSVQGFAEGSAAEEAGLETGDRIVELEGRPVSDFAGVKMGLLGKRPGDTVSLKVERDTDSDSPDTLAFDITLR